MRIRLRAPGGASTINLPDDATVGDLIAEIVEKTAITKFDIKYGYPPKPLLLEQNKLSLPLRDLAVQLDGEQLTINPKEDPTPSKSAVLVNQQADHGDQGKMSPPKSEASAGKEVTRVSFGGITSTSKQTTRRPIPLQKQAMPGEVPEIPMPSRGSTLVLRVMPDDNSCLFRAFGTAVLPGDHLTMPELRSLVAQAIQDEPDVYTKVVLDQDPDQYCRWIQTDDAWGGAIEMGILSKHFDIEICSIDVKSLRVDKFNEGRPNRCILVYSGIHYDTIVQSPSDPPHTKADSPPEFDQRIWNLDDDEILVKAGDLCEKLQAMHYYTDTGGMAIKCEVCGSVVYGEAQASQHAEQTGHYDMSEITAEL